MKMEPIEGSETSAIINQTPGNYFHRLKCEVYFILQPMKMEPDRRFRNVGNYKPDAGELSS